MVPSWKGYLPVSKQHEGHKRHASLKTSPAALSAIFVLVCLCLSLLPLSDLYPEYAPPHKLKVKVKSGQPPLRRDLQDNVQFSQPRCRAEFSRFYPQLEENEKVWKNQGGLTYSHVQDAARNCVSGCAHVVLKHGQIFIRGTERDWQSRVRSMLQLLQTAYMGASQSEQHLMDGIEFVMSGGDYDAFKKAEKGRGAGWVLDKRNTDTMGQYLYPDFSFASWPEAGIPSYQEVRRQARKINDESAWHTKPNPIFWRGETFPSGEVLPRASLVKVAMAPGTESWSNVRRTSFWGHEADVVKQVTPADHCLNKFLLHSEGVAYSGRSKYLLGCKSAVVMHELEWTQHFHPAIITDETSPDQNAVVLKGKYFEHLPETIKGLIAEEEEPKDRSSGMTTGERIANNSFRTMAERYLTPAATACYLRAALISYGRAMDRTTWPGGNGAQVIPGSGVKPGAGTSIGTLKELGVDGDIEYGVWINLGFPNWPPLS